MSAHYELHPHRELSAPVLLLATESWIDAGFGAQGAIAHTLEQIPTEPLATFATDDFIDYRARRPIARIRDGVLSGLAWPELALRAGQDHGGRGILVLVGPEPDLAWHAFVNDVVELATRCQVRLVVSLGAYAAPVPHTRPVRLTAISTRAELAARVGVTSGSADLPAGIQTALQEGFSRVGVPAIGVWARVPHYLAAMPYPAASAALVETFASLTGLDVDPGPLRLAADSVVGQIDDVLANSTEHRELVRQLEAAYDGGDGATTPLSETDLPSGDELAAELERFLRGEQDSN